MKISIVRVSSIAEGTFGVLLQDGVPFAVTAELPWKQNQPKISCIPAGAYTCKRIKSPKFGETFEITNVPNRSHILFHAGNIPLEDSLGCILVAEQFEMVDGKLGIQQSRKGLSELHFKLIGFNSFELEIKNATS